MQSFTFNRCTVALFLIPLLLFMAMMIFGLYYDFQAFTVVLLALTTGMAVYIVWMGFFRRMKIGEGGFEWISPKANHRISTEEVKHFGIIRYRAFRFLYLSREAEPPFNDATRPVVTSEDTFVIQYRPRAWEALKAEVLRLHPDMAAKHYRDRRN